MQERSAKAVPARVSSVSKRPFKGHVYNVTTETGNLFVEDILVHNSGGLGTPPHLRVEPGMIHRASGGVLFLDEIAILTPKSQQELLTAMQEKKYGISGQSELSSGAMTKTEPVPCFPGKTFLLTSKGNVAIGDFVDSILFESRGNVVVRDELEVFDLDVDKRVLAYCKGEIVPSNVEKVYRRRYSGKVLKIRFDDGTELMATPEHPIKTSVGFLKAQDLSPGAVVEASNALNLVDEKFIIETYDVENQRTAKAFNKWLASGKKVSAKNLGVDSKTVYSWKKGTVPHALKPVCWFRGKKLLPLQLNDERLATIARVAGALFGDGGIDGRRLSRIYFCTDMDGMSDLDEFKDDILSIFGEEIGPAITIRKTVSKKGSGLVLSVNNSAVARFFYALGVPKGDKVSQPFSAPLWIKLSDQLEREFFSSLLVCELYGNIKSSQDVPSFVMAKLKSFEKEHIDFLNEIRAFLLKNKVETREVKQDKEYIKTKGLSSPAIAGTYFFKINSGYRNLTRLVDAVNFYYAKNKRASIFDGGGKGKRFLASRRVLNRLKEEALILRTSGKTIRAISKETGLCKNTVWKLVKRTYNKYSEADRQKVLDLLSKGAISKVIAKKLKMPYTTVLYWKKNYFYGDS